MIYEDMTQEEVDSILDGYFSCETTEEVTEEVVEEHGDEKLFDKKDGLWK